jgi:hypothetical protein
VDLGSYILCEILGLVPEMTTFVRQPFPRSVDGICWLGSDISEDTLIWSENASVILDLKITHFLSSSNCKECDESNENEFVH